MNLLTLQSPHATATLSPYGGQAMSFTPNGQPDVLWQTAPHFLQTALQFGKAMRGGVPLCWPWFNKLNPHPGAPSHGFARLRTWAIESQTPTTATLSLMLDGTDESFPHPLKATLEATLTDRLHLALTTTNLGDTDAPLQQALHTYLNVGDVARVTVHGLEGRHRVHITPAVTEAPLAAPLTITGEVEHLFSPIQSIRVEDPVLGRTLHISNRGGEQAVIWNPGAEKAKGLDMDPDAYKTMLCVEAANISLGPITGAITLAPGASHTLETTLWSERV